MQADINTFLLFAFWIAVIGGIVAFTLISRRRMDKRVAKRQADFDAWFPKYEAWWQDLSSAAANPESDPDRLRELAVAAMPSEPIYHVAYIEILRMVATNPSTPTEIRNGVISRIGSEESAIRTNAQLQQMQQQLQQFGKKRGGGLIVGGGVSFPLD